MHDSGRSDAPRWHLRRGARALACAAAVLLGAFAASADAVHVTTETRRGEGAQAVEGHLWIDGSRLRLEQGGGDAPVVIYRGDRDLLWSVEPDRQRYTEIDRKTLQQLADRVAEARRQMEERLAQIPPEQRAMVERMMGSSPAAGVMAGGTPPAPLEVEATDARREVAGTSCRVHRLVRSGELRGEVCVADWDDVPAGRSDFKVLREMADLARDLVRSARGDAELGLGEQPFEVIDRLDGFPIASRQIRNGEVVSETVFTKVEKADPPPDLFEVPEGYAREELPTVDPT